MKYEKPGKKESQKDRRQKHLKVMSKPLSKRERENVYQKYDGRCAYCGRNIEYRDMQVDHKIPKARLHFREHETADWWDNLMPSCRRCNHYKKADSLEVFRRQLMTIQDRIAKDYSVKVAIDYGVITFHPFDGEFFFEKHKRGLIK